MFLATLDLCFSSHFFFLARHVRFAYCVFRRVIGRKRFGQGALKHQAYSINQEKGKKGLQHCILNSQHPLIYPRSSPASF